MARFWPIWLTFGPERGQQQQSSRRWRSGVPVLLDSSNQQANNHPWWSIKKACSTNTMYKLVPCSFYDVVEKNLINHNAQFYTYQRRSKQPHHEVLRGLTLLKTARFKQLYNRRCTTPMRCTLCFAVAIKSIGKSVPKHSCSPQSPQFTIVKQLL